MTSNIFSYEAPFLRAALGQFKEYLLSADIFWNLALRAAKEQPPYPQLSLANLLLAQARLQAAQKGGLLTVKELTQLSSFDERLAEMHAAWHSAWSGKAEKEFGVRLRQWARFLDDLNAATSGQGGAFLAGLRIRTLLQLLLTHLPAESSPQQAEMTLLDQRYKHLSIPADFVWQPELSAYFSKDPFFFLHTQAKN